MESDFSVRFCRDVAALFQRLGAPFSSGKIASLVETLKLIVPQQQNPARHLIGFRNGVLDTRTGLFSPHCKENWLRTVCEVDFTPPVKGETLKLMPGILALAGPGRRTQASKARHYSCSVIYGAGEPL